MVRLMKNGGVVEVKDYLAKLYLRNGFEIVEDKPKEEETVKAAPTPKKTTTRKTKKTQ